MGPHSDRFEVVTDFAFVGRTYEEYERFFDLGDWAPDGTRVLDCGAGASSFVAEAADRGADVMALDRLYGPPGHRLARRARADLANVAAELRSKTDLFAWDFYGDVDARLGFLERGSRRFLRDYECHPGRYVAGALPSLPFPDDAFDLVLCSHLLFLYADRLDRSFHVAAVRELARVGGEVRCFPLAAMDTDRSPHVEPVRAALEADGRSTEVRSVPFEFQPGATQMLVVR